MQDFEKINECLEYRIVKQSNNTRYRGSVTSENKYHIINFCVPATLYLFDLGYSNFEISFRVRNDFFNKYSDFGCLEEDYHQAFSEIFFEERDFPICFAVHTNLICLAASASQGIQRKIFIESYFMFLLYQYSASRDVRKYFSANRCADCQMMKKIHDAEKWLEQNLNAAINLHNICYSQAISQDVFNLYFEKKKGCNIYQFLLKKRMEKASYLINNTYHSMKYIAQETGYSNENTFRKAYENFYGNQPVLCLAN